MSNKRYEYRYIIFYSYNKGCGNMDLITTEPLERLYRYFENKNKTETLISEKYNVEGVIITDWKFIYKTRK